MIHGFASLCFKAGILAAVLVFTASADANAHDFSIVGNAEQMQQIERSLASCPSLPKTLNDLTKSAGFQQIRVTTSDETKRTGPFLAAVAGNEIILAGDWLALQNQPYSDVRIQGEILPDNLCFDLGHLSEHVLHPLSASPTGQDMRAWVDQRIEMESRAFIRGWPFVLEAARAKNGDKPLSGGQAGHLLMNLRYRFAFLRAMAPTANPKLNILDDGTIPETDANVAAIAAGLHSASIADLQ